MRNLVMLALVSVVGCSAEKSFSLDDAYAPLKEIREHHIPWSASAITTIGDASYVSDLDAWLAKAPPGSIKFLSIMRHEQEHSKRQHSAGVALWISNYLFDANFALLEEKIGFFYEIETARSLGGRVSAEAYAKLLSDYIVATGRLISYDDALVWVNDVINGRWTPPN